MKSYFEAKNLKGIGEEVQHTKTSYKIAFVVAQALNQMAYRDDLQGTINKINLNITTLLPHKRYMNAHTSMVCTTIKTYENTKCCRSPAGISSIAVKTSLIIRFCPYFFQYRILLCTINK